MLLRTHVVRKDVYKFNISFPIRLNKQVFLSLLSQSILFILLLLLLATRHSLMLYSNKQTKRANIIPSSSSTLCLSLLKQSYFSFSGAQEGPDSKWRTNNNNKKKKNCMQVSVIGLLSLYWRSLKR